MKYIHISKRMIQEWNVDGNICSAKVINSHTEKCQFYVLLCA